MAHNNRSNDEMAKELQSLREQVAAMKKERREQACVALQTGVQQAAAAIEAARAFTFSYDIATGEITWGGAIEEITGYTPEELAQVNIQGWAERIHPEDRDEVLSVLHEATTRLDRATAEYRFRTKPGGYVELASISITESKEFIPLS